MVGQPYPSLILQDWDDTSRIPMILGPEMPALEEQLKFWGQVRNTQRPVKDSRLPVSGNDRIAPVDPSLVGALIERQIESPRMLGVTTGPDIVLISLGV